MSLELYELYVNSTIKEKLLLKVPSVEVIEVEEAFYSFKGRALIDNRENNKTRPPTVWFISETMEGRLLKVVGIFKIDLKLFVLKTAYEPDLNEVELYEKYQI